MLEPADSHGHALDVARERFSVELGEQTISLDAADPLKDFQATEVCGKAKVVSPQQVRNAQRRHRNLVRIEVGGFVIDRIDIRQPTGKPAEALVRRIWDNIEILRGPHVTVSTDSKPANGDVFDTVFLQALQQRNRIKRAGHP